MDDPQCWAWAAKYFDDDVCTLRDKVGFILGLISVACWGLAEVPQLIVNAMEGSSEGIAEGLLVLWVFSDVLDVIGCTISDTVSLAWGGGHPGRCREPARAACGRPRTALPLRALPPRAHNTNPVSLCLTLPAPHPSLEVAHHGADRLDVLHIHPAAGHPALLV